MRPRRGTRRRARWTDKSPHETARSSPKTDTSRRPGPAIAFIAAPDLGVRALFGDDARARGRPSAWGTSRARARVPPRAGPTVPWVGRALARCASGMRTKRTCARLQRDASRIASVRTPSCRQDRRACPSVASNSGEEGSAPRLPQIGARSARPREQFPAHHRRRTAKACVRLRRIRGPTLLRGRFGREHVVSASPRRGRDLKSSARPAAKSRRNCSTLRGSPLLVSATSWRSAAVGPRE